jgi:hypothetical protein
VAKFLHVLAQLSDARRQLGDPSRWLAFVVFVCSVELGEVSRDRRVGLG